MIDDSQIFLSYAREDISRVESLYQRLTEAGFNVWMDTRRLLPGQMWPDEIEQAIKRSELVIICLSRVSVRKRGFLQREIRRARDYSQERPEGEIYLIPARLDDCEVPTSLTGIQWVDLFAGDGWEKLVKAITTSLDDSRAVTKEPPPPGSKVKVTPSQNVAEPCLFITSPPDAAQVDWQTWVEGRAPDTRAAVWLVVHPTGVSEYWVQPPVSIREGGRWGVEAYFGRGGGADAGKHFEIMALMNPEEELKEGVVLHGWPAAGEKSQLVMVTRRAAAYPDAPPRPDAARSVGDGSVSIGGSASHSIILGGSGHSVNVGGAPPPARNRPKRRK